MQRINSFSPIIDEHSKILILGSVPGVKSLQIQEYYAHPQNKFWQIMFHLFVIDKLMNYDEKVKLLKSNQIALWDVIESCERKGSKDNAIKNELNNDINFLVETHPNLNAIFCNGQKAYQNLIKHLGKNYKIPIMVLPSTSPLHTISFEEKLKNWSNIIDYLNKKEF